MRSITLDTSITMSGGPNTSGQFFGECCTVNLRSFSFRQTPDRTDGSCRKSIMVGMHAMFRIISVNAERTDFHNHFKYPVSEFFRIFELKSLVAQPPQTQVLYADDLTSVTQFLLAD